MPRQIIFDLVARLEFEDAIVWYNEQELGLGDRFEAEIDAAFQRILKDPERFQIAHGKIRKARVEVFDQYSIYFRAEARFIGVVSIFHGARNPDELRRRLE
jgi:plasmid stabilization system protein ParE